MDIKINNLFFTNFILLLLSNILLIHTNNIWLMVLLMVLLIINLYLFFAANYNIIKKREKNNDIFYKWYKKVTLLDLFFFLIISLVYTPFLFIFIMVMFISILWHEAWHALFMKIFWVKLVDFSIWFWAPIYSKKFKNITFNIRNILLGGYVKPIDDEIVNDLKKIKNDNKYMDTIIKKHNIKKSELYLSKRLRQKIIILSWWVMFNLFFAIISLFLLINILWNKQYNEKQLTKQQKTFVAQERKKNIKERWVYLYMLKEMPPTIWLHTRSIKNADNILSNTIYETKNAVLLTIYSISYAIHNPSAFMQFKSFVWIGKTIYKLEEHNLMNVKILLMLIVLINISLFLINITPLPALDWGQIIKELIAHSARKIMDDKEENGNIYNKIIFSKYIIFSEYIMFSIIFVYMIALVLKDIFT